MTEFVRCLRITKTWAGEPSVRELTRRVNAERHHRAGQAGVPTRRVVTSTVGYCFDPGRKRLDYDLVFELLRAMGLTEAHLAWWRQAWQSVFARRATLVAANVTAEFPDDVPCFSGRTAELTRLLDRIRQPAASPVVSVIEGMAGVGKTALAVHAVHQLAEHDLVRFFVNLRGFDPEQPAVEPEVVLDSFLRRLGIPGSRIPGGVNARARLYRQLSRRRPALIVLDNATGTEQVLPLLPAGPGHRVLITSRHTLADLPGAQHVLLDPFTPHEALQFLRAAVGAGRIDTEPDAAREVCRLCGHLPLALSMIAMHVRSARDWLLADHLDRLRALGPADGIQAALTLSYRKLDPSARRMFRLVGINPGTDLTVYSAAALADVHPRLARRQLGKLVAEHLMSKSNADRYSVHDLVLAYAMRRAHDEDPASQRREALTRLFDFYLHTASEALDAAHPSEQHRRPGVQARARWRPPLPDLVTARGWLDGELPNLFAAIAHTAVHGWPRHAGQLAATIWRHLDTTGRYADIVAIHEQALGAARQLGDRSAEALVRHNLGTVHWRLGRKVRAIAYFEQALALRQLTGDLPGQAKTLNNLGIVLDTLGRHDDALRHYQRALEIFRTVGDRVGEAGALSNIGVVHEHGDRFDEADDHQQRALLIFRETRSAIGEANALANLCVIHRRQRHYASATDYEQRALAIFRAIGDRSGEADGLINLADIHHDLRQHDSAALLCRQALAIARELGDPGLEAEAHNSYARTLHATGQLDDATRHHTIALELARHSDDQMQEARALSGLARTAHSTGRTELAETLERRAEVVYRCLGVPIPVDPVTT